MHAPSGHYVYMSHQGRGSHFFTHRLFVERRQNDIITVKASNGAPSSSSNCYASLFSPLIRPRQQQPGEKKKEEKNRSRLKQSAVFVLSWTASSIFCCVEVKRVAMRSKETHVMQRDSQLQANERAGLLEMRHAHACNGNWGSVSVSQLRSS